MRFEAHRVLLGSNTSAIFLGGYILAMLSL